MPEQGNGGTREYDASRSNWHAPPGRGAWLLPIPRLPRLRHDLAGRHVKRDLVAFVAPLWLSHDPNAKTERIKLEAEIVKARVVPPSFIGNFPCFPTREAPLRRVGQQT
jgi:hypothetical protein